MSLRPFAAGGKKKPNAARTRRRQRTRGTYAGEAAAANLVVIVEIRRKNA